MSSLPTQTAKQPKFSVAITTTGYQKLINNTLKDPERAKRFIASITSAVAVNPALQECEAGSILAGALLGESLNLSPSPQLGQYYLVPFKCKEKKDRLGNVISPEITKAQFIIGYKGYIQLALRSGAYADLDVMEIREGEYQGKHKTTGKPQFSFIEDDDERELLPVVGYMAYFEYLNGFRKVIYWSKAKMMNHADKYSPAYSAESHQKIISCLGDIVEMHKDVVQQTFKTTGGLSYKGVSLGREHNEQISLGNGSNNISAINSELQRCITNYFLTCSEERKIILQFDRLDDNYNQYQNLDSYYHAIISLFKVVYQLNQEFRSKNIQNAKIILYLRTDIMKELGKKDSESARWDDFTFEINWSIINRNEWKNSNLLEMINKRIETSGVECVTTFEDVFNNKDIDLINASGQKCDVFKYIIERTMHRPRDVIQFCKCIQKEVNQTDKLYYRTIKDAEKRFGYWLINSELANEINPILENPDSLYELLREFGKKDFSLKDFSKKLQSYEEIKMNSDELAKLSCKHKKSDKFRLVGFFYPSRQAWYIITRQRVYHQHGIAVLYLITPSGVHLCRLDDIQNFVLMICNSCGIDDIQCYALILTKLYSIIITKEVVICLLIICLCIPNSWQLI